MKIKFALAAALILVVDVARAALPLGATAPDFQIQGALAGKEFRFSLADQLKKGPVVLYFYPKSFTSVCTEEAHLFAEATPQFAALGATVIGVSGDDIATQRASFRARNAATNSRSAPMPTSRSPKPTTHLTAACSRRAFPTWSRRTAEFCRRYLRRRQNLISGARWKRCAHGKPENRADVASPSDLVVVRLLAVGDPRRVAGIVIVVDLRP